MADKFTLGAAASMNRKVAAAKTVQAEAVRIANMPFEERFIPTSQSERDAAAVAFLKRETFAGRPVIRTDRITGKQLTGLDAAKHMLDVREAEKMFEFQQRTGRNPLDPENRALTREEQREVRRSGQRAVEKQRRTRRDPFATPKPRKQAKGFKPTRQKRQAPGTARSIITRSRPRTRKA